MEAVQLVWQALESEAVCRTYCSRLRWPEDLSAAANSVIHASRTNSVLPNKCGCWTVLEVVSQKLALCIALTCRLKYAEVPVQYENFIALCVLASSAGLQSTSES